MRVQSPEIFNWQFDRVGDHAQVCWLVHADSLGFERRCGRDVEAILLGIFSDNGQCQDIRNVINRFGRQRPFLGQRPEVVRPRLFKCALHADRATVVSRHCQIPVPKLLI